MEKEFIPYEQALALKELGFDEPCFTFYLNGKIRLDGNNVHCTLQKKVQYIYNAECLAPTFSQAFRWFREKYGLVPTVHPYHELRKFTWDYNYNIVEYAKDTIYGDLRELTYEEAELECLKKLIEIVKEKK